MLGSIIEAEAPNDQDDIEVSRRDTQGNLLEGESFRMAKDGVGPPLDPRLRSKWLILPDDEIWSKLNDRFSMYVKDSSYDFVESMPYFNLCTRFHENFYKEIPDKEKGLEVRCNLLQYLIVMNLRVMQHHVVFPLLKELKRLVKTLIDDDRKNLASGNLRPNAWINHQKLFYVTLLFGRCHLAASDKE
jgi:hypothetical protein